MPSRSSQVKPSARAAGGSTRSKPSSVEELDGALDLGGRDLDADVLEHQNSSETRAATTTIAVDQVIASATVRLSSP